MSSVEEFAAAVGDILAENAFGAMSDAKALMEISRALTDYEASDARGADE